MPSAISAARANLFDLMEADAGYADVQVTFGAPAGHEEQEVVALLGVDDADEEDVALGAQRSDEVFVLEVGIKVYDPAGDAPEVDAKGFALYEVLRSVVNANRTLGGTVRRAKVSRLRTDGAQPAEVEAGMVQGWGIYLRVFVACAVRIT